jgi:hypothetical protein
MNKPSYKIKLSVEQDALNWYNACNGKSMQGKDWTEKMDPIAVKVITGLSREKAFDFLIPYLNEKYKKEEPEILAFKEFAEREFSVKFSKACEEMKNAMGGMELYRDDFTIYITTINRCPYNKETGTLYVSILGKDPISIFLHELCHFQFIHYWQENIDSPVNKLNDEEFNYLKESLTMIIGKDMFSIILNPDRGYDKHKDFRLKLKEFWQKERNFDKLVEYGLKELPNFINTK